MGRELIMKRIDLYGNGMKRMKSEDKLRSPCSVRTPCTRVGPTSAACTAVLLKTSKRSVASPGTLRTRHNAYFSARVPFLQAAPMLRTICHSHFYQLTQLKNCGDESSSN